MPAYTDPPDRRLDPPAWAEAPECECGCCELCGWPLDYLIGHVAGWRVPVDLVRQWVAGAAAGELKTRREHMATYLYTLQTHMTEERPEEIHQIEAATDTAAAEAASEICADLDTCGTLYDYEDRRVAYLSGDRWSLVPR